jgi:hypothetical protein
MKRLPVLAIQQNLFEVENISPTPKEKGRQKTGDGYVFDLVDALSAPILTFSHSWADTIPTRIMDIVPLARMKAMMLKEEIATYVECTAYIYTRTLEAPMDSDWVDIYTHITCKTLEEWFGEDRWKEVNAPKELSEWLSSKLTDLRRWIYKKRREMLKARIKEQERTEKVEGPEKDLPKEKKHDTPPRRQQSLF